MGAHASGCIRRQPPLTSAVAPLPSLSASFSVCRLWRSLSVAAWQHVCVDEDRAPRFESFHLTYLAGARSLQSTTALSLAHCSALCDRALSLAWTHMPDLTQLDLSHCDQLTDNALQAFATAPGEWKRAAGLCSGAWRPLGA